MSSYTAEMIHGLDRPSAPLSTPPQTRWQVWCYQQGSHERSAGIYGSPKPAETASKRIRGSPTARRLVIRETGPTSRPSTAV